MNNRGFDSARSFHSCYQAFDLQSKYARRDSNPNLLIRSQMLYPLSYGRRYVVMWRRREDLNLRSP